MRYNDECQGSSVVEHAPEERVVVSSTLTLGKLLALPHYTKEILLLCYVQELQVICCKDQ